MKMILGIAISIASLSFWGVSPVSHAQANQAQPLKSPAAEKIRKALVEVEKKTDQKIIAIFEAKELPGMYEVRLKSNRNGAVEIIYTTKEGTHLIGGGNLVRVKDFKNITAEKKAEIARIDFAKDLPKSAAIKTVIGNGEAEIAIFEDPNCGYCRKLRRDSISQLNNVTIYTYPVAFLGPDSRDTVNKVLCSQNPADAWEKVIINGEKISGSPDCKNALDEIMSVARKVGVNSTPAVYFKNGTLALGAIPKDDFIERFKTNSR